MMDSGSWFAIWAICLKTSFFVMMPRSLPLRVTRHCRSPSFRKMSTTVSMGVWSVTVNGLRLRTRRSFRGCGLLAGSSGGSSVKYMIELLTMPSCLCLAFFMARISSLLWANPMRRSESLETTTGKPL